LALLVGPLRRREVRMMDKGRAVPTGTALFLLCQLSFRDIIN